MAVGLPPSLAPEGLNCLAMSEECIANNLVAFTIDGLGAHLP